MSGGALVIACGALSWELAELRQRNDWPHLKIRCLPPELHNTPEKIPGAVASAIEAARDDHLAIFVAYADCGTGGALDRVIAEHGASRLPGAHCYEFFAGPGAFAAYCEEEPGTFYLTDFLVRHFDRLVVESLGLDRHPELAAQYFGNYRRVVYLAQTESAELTELAERHARFLALDFERRFTGLAPLETTLREQVVQWQN